jgi:hypothetical protein
MRSTRKHIYWLWEAAALFLPVWSREEQCTRQCVCAVSHWPLLTQTLPCSGLLGSRRLTSVPSCPWLLLSTCGQALQGAWTPKEDKWNALVRATSSAPLPAEALLDSNRFFLLFALSGLGGTTSHGTGPLGAPLCPQLTNTSVKRLS